MSSDGVLIHGFGFSGFRSFAQPGVALSPLGKVNLLAGQNNAGKSNALRFARDLLKAHPTGLSREFDRPAATLPQDWNLHLHLFVPELRRPARPDDRESQANMTRVLDALHTAPGLAAGTGIELAYLLEPSPGSSSGHIQHGWKLAPPSVAKIADHLRQQRIDPMRAVNLFTGQTYSGGGSPEGFTDELLRSVAPDLAALPPVRIIQAFRQIRPSSGGDETGLFDGVGLVERLQQLASPREIGAARDDLREKYDRINAFVRHILDDPSATLHIPYDASTVQIQRGSSVLPLDSLGTGVHQVVMLAAAATLLSGTLIGLEEPEVHLHPLLQRRLIKYLAEKTDNQYLIATHSAHLLDYEAAKIFHLTYGEAGTEVAPAGTPNDLSKVCADLGYRPSDLLQSNAVIWVEGPSDRIYIRCWLHLVDPTLLEGIHYSVMFYGGGLLSHLTPDDPANPGLAIEEHDKDVDDFISLRRLNRHLAVVIDSDKTSPRKHINATKQRVKAAFNEGNGPGFAWVTECYTIENYVPRALLEQAVAAVHPHWKLAPDEGQWANPLRFEGGQRPNKVSIARFVAKRWTTAHLKNLRLDRQIETLVELIRAANGHAPR